LTKLTHKPNIVLRDRLFYDQYPYCMSAVLKEACAMRELSHEFIDNVISVRRHYLLNSKNFYRHRLAHISDDIVTNLHKLCQLLLDTSHQFKLVIEFNSIRLYSMDDSLPREILDSDIDLGFLSFKQAVVDRPRDTIQLKNPQHTHRSYFNRAKITEAQKESIVHLLNNNTDTLRLSPGLKTWTVQPFKWTDTYYFVDHSDESWILMMSLIRPRLIKKTIQLIKS
jgi:hypothetical protein